MNVDRRVRKTRGNLKQALIDLIHEKEFEVITILDITEKADVNRGTFYHHYLDKFDLLEKTITEKLETLKVEVTPTEDEQLLFELVLSDDIDSLSKGVLSSKPFIRVFKHMKQEAYFYKPMFNTKVFNYFYPSFIVTLKGYFNRVESKIESSEIDVDKELFVSYILFALLGVFRQWIQSDMAVSPEYMGEQLKTLLSIRAFGFRERNGEKD